MKRTKRKKWMSFFLALVILAGGTAITTAVQASTVDFETRLAMEGFPESYKVLLRQLHEQHPTWDFEALHTGITLEAAVTGQQNATCTKNLVYHSSSLSLRCQCPNCYRDGQYIPKESGIWYGASAQAITYYLDPRNFLDEQYIFQFLNQSYDSASETEAGVERILSGTYMAGAKADYVDAAGVQQTSEKTYAQLIMEAAKQSGASAYYLAAKIKQEIGSVPSTSTSGTNAVYPGIYNFYNIGAYTGALDGLKWASASAAADEGSVRATSGLNLRTAPSTQATVIRVIPQGAKVKILAEEGDWYQVSYNGSVGYASATYIEKGAMSYNRPWTSPELSIINGAKWIAENYINQGQYTGYLQKFNVNPDSKYQMFDHQYMTNVQGAASEGASTYKAYQGMGLLEEELTFVIPVYDNMPNDPGASLTMPETSVEDLQIGQTHQLTAIPYPLDLAVSWSSSDSNVAVVDGSGLVTAVGTGSALITATAGGISRSAVVQVAGVAEKPAESVTVTPDTLTMTVGDSSSLAAGVYPADTTDAVTWSSSNPNVVRVDAGGQLVAVGVGEADVFATADSGAFGTAHIYVNQRKVDAEYITSGFSRTGTVQNVSTTLNVRSGPGIGYSVVARLSNHAKLAIQYETGEWYAVTAGSTSGFVHQDYVALDTQWNMKAGEQSLFEVQVYPADANSQLTFSSSDSAVASVDRDGVVTAHSAGSAVITALTDNGRSCSIVVQVSGSTAPPSGGNVGAQATVSASALNVRSGPGTSYTVISVLPRGKTVSILGSSGAWYWIEVNGITGYVSGEYLSVYGGSRQTGEVTASALNLRTGPGTSYAVLTTLPRGAQVEVLSASGGWYQVQYNGCTGYVSSEYLRVSGASAVRTGTVTASALNVRTGPGTGYGIQTVIARGTAVTVHEASGSWYHITFTKAGRSYDGYASAEYIAF